MRHILPGAVLTTFVATALSRYLPPEVFAISSRPRESTNLSLITGTSTLPLVDAATFPSPSSLYLPGVNGITDGVITTQTLGNYADDILWEKHINKDKSLICAMQGTDAVVGWQVFDTRKLPSGASKWVNFNHMAA